MDQLDSHKTLWGNLLRELCKDTGRCLKQILEVSPDKTTALRQLTAIKFPRPSNQNDQDMFGTTKKRKYELLNDVIYDVLYESMGTHPSLPINKNVLEREGGRYMYCSCWRVDILFVTYWPSTKPSIKRCTCVNKRKQVDIKQKYNQDGDGLSQSELESVEGQDTSVRIGCRLRDCCSQWPTVKQPQPRWGIVRRAIVRRTLGQYVVVCPRLQLTSHTQPTSTHSRIKCERYIFIKKCVRSSLLLTMFPLIFVYVYSYTTF